MRRASAVGPPASLGVVVNPSSRVASAGPLVAPSETVKSATSTLGCDDPGSVLALIDAAAVAGGAFAAVGVALLAGVTATPLAGAGVAVCVAVGGRRALVVVARLRRTRALSGATALVGRAALWLRLEPTAERAASFAAETGDGDLASSLATHARAARGTPESGLRRFGDSWSESFPPLSRSCALLCAAAAAGADDRAAMLDRAVASVREGTRDRAARFAADARTTVAGVYAGGVLLPLALVGVLPAARVAGVGVSLPALAAVYDCLLPVGLVAASASVVSERPVAFPPSPVPSAHPALPDGRRRELAVGVAAAVVGGVVTLPVAEWATFLSVVGFGVGAWAVAAYGPAKRAREDVRDIESRLADAATLLGRRVATGESVETALEGVAEELPGSTGDALATAARRSRRLGLPVEAGLLGSDGVFETVPSARGSELATMVGLAAREGRPAGELLIALGDHLDALDAVEREARRELAATTRTLTNTAALFGPLVGGATVALAGRLSAGDVASGAGAGTAGAANAVGASPVGGGLAPVPVGGLGLVIGTYVLLSAVVLTALATSLDRGLDRAVVGYRVGVALIAATATFLAAFVGARAVL
ncbi:MAG: type II secretion system protein [Halolamina sp.]